MLKKLFNKIFGPKTPTMADYLENNKHLFKLYCVNYVAGEDCSNEMKFYCQTTSEVKAANCFWEQHSMEYYHIVSISVVRENTCTTCRFVNKEKNICTVGTYYAEKGLNKICYAGELWEIKTN